MVIHKDFINKYYYQRVNINLSDTWDTSPITVLRLAAIFSFQNVEWETKKVNSIFHDNE